MHPVRLVPTASPRRGDEPTAPRVPDRSAENRALPPEPRRAADEESDAAAPPAPAHRRPRPWLLVAVDDDPSSTEALVWALREAARREATVVAVSVCGNTVAAGDDPDAEWPGSTCSAHPTLLADLDARVSRATADAGVRPRVRTAVLDAEVFEVFAGAARGADLVVVGSHGKTLLRPAVPRPSVRRFPRPV